MTTQQAIVNYAHAGYPAVAINTADEDRAVAIMSEALNRPNSYRIAAKGGLIDVRTNETVNASATYAQAFEQAAADDTVIFVLDFQHRIKQPVDYRSLRDSLNRIKAAGGMIILVAPSWVMPAEVEHDIPVMQDSLPSREELTTALNVCVTATGATLDEETRNRMLDAARGLTLSEAEGAMALSFDGRKFDPAAVSEEKMKLVRQSGYLEVQPPAKPEDVGGLYGAREYITNEIMPVLGDPDLAVRGMMLVGVPGTGKSLLARALGAMLNRPTLRCDIGSLKGSLQGESERKMREMLKLAEAVAPVVLYFDEIEKGLSGHASSAQTDGGTLNTMIGTLLNWMQEHKSDIIVVATCNDFSKLPAEFTRAGGRFDEKFFVDLPGIEERREISAVHLRKYGANGECAEALAKASENWTGAEIEQCVKSAARRTRRAITPEAIIECAKDIRPLSRTRAEEIKALQKWGREELRAANTARKPVAPTGGRRIAGVR